MNILLVLSNDLCPVFKTFFDSYMKPLSNGTVHFQPILIFACKAGAYPSLGTFYR